MMSAVGDTVHVLPVIRALKRHDRAVRITWILQPGPASLVAGHPDVDEILVFPRERGWKAFGDVRRQLRGRTWDLVLDLQVYFKASVVTALARAPVKLGFDRARARDLNWLATNRRIQPHPPQHVQAQYFEFLHHLGVDPEPVSWELGPWPGERAWQRAFFARFDRPVAALNVATSHPDRDWMPDRWAGVADALVERHGLTPVLVGGATKRERETAAAIEAHARHRPHSALGSGLRPLVSILDGSALVVALDSAPLHLAVALGRPVVSLMSNADPRRTGPFRRFTDLVVDAYHDPGEEDAPVSMRRRPGRMGRITVERVLEKVALWDRRYRSAP